MRAYKFERIVNGWLAEHSDGTKVFCPDVAAISKFIMGPLERSIDEMRHFQWDGKFEVTFGSTILKDNDGEDDL
jgi:hypothetical protein